MKTRMSENSLQSFKIAEKITKRGLILTFIKNNPNSTYEDIVRETGIKLPTVVGRLNELLYQFQQIKVTGMRGLMNMYSVRKDSDKLNQRPLSESEKKDAIINEMQSKINACIIYCNKMQNTAYGKIITKEIIEILK